MTKSHINIILALFCVMQLLASCSYKEKRESSLRVVSDADSLDRCGMLYADTLQLRAAAESLCELTHRTEKAKALYYLGRNYNGIFNYSAAVDEFISASKLHSKDSVLNGRIYSNMMFICREHGNDSLALLFAKEAGRYFQNSGIRSAYNILDKIIIYSKLKQFSSADSLIKIATENIIDDNYYYIGLQEAKIKYYYMQQEYKQTLQCFHSIPTANLSSYSMIHAALCYYYLAASDSAGYYANKIIESSKVQSHRISAYYILIDEVDLVDPEIIKEYSAKRMDAQRERDEVDNNMAVAVNKLEDFNNETNNSITYILLICSGIILIGVILIYLFKTHVRLKKQQKSINKTNNLLTEHENTIESLTQSNNTLEQYLLSTHEKQKNQYEERIKILQHQIADAKVSLSSHSKLMKNPDVLHEFLNTHFYHLSDKLDILYDLDFEEKRVCFVVLMGLSHKEAANILCCSENSISQKKHRIAKKLNTTGALLQNFLMKTACANSD